jgi:hypothetical protein
VSVPNNKEDVPLEIYRARYRVLDTEDAAARTGCAYEDGFAVPMLGHDLRAAHPDFALTSDADAPAALLAAPNEILVLRWLLEGRRAAWSGAFLAYREVPWGEVYDRNFDGRCRQRLAGTFGRDPEGFTRAALRLGGARVRLGDAAFDLPLPGGNTIRLILRLGDEEFPPGAQILFSDNIVHAWSAEDLAVLGEVVIKSLSQKRA